MSWAELFGVVTWELRPPRSMKKEGRINRQCPCTFFVFFVFLLGFFFVCCLTGRCRPDKRVGLGTALSRLLGNELVTQRWPAKKELTNHNWLQCQEGTKRALFFRFFSGWERILELVECPQALIRFSVMRMPPNQNGWADPGNCQPIKCGQWLLPPTWCMPCRWTRYFFYIVAHSTTT